MNNKYFASCLTDAKTTILFLFVFVSTIWGVSAKTVSMSVANSITTATATTYRDTYVARTTKNTKNNSFAFNAAQLRQYLVQSGSPLVEFTMGENPDSPANTRNIHLLVTPIDADGTHIYMKDLNNVCHLMIDTILSDTISSTLETAPSTVLIHSADFMTTTAAKTKIYNYRKPANSIKRATNGWTGNALELIRYLDPANSPDIKYVQFIIGETGSTLDLLFVAYNGTNHMYFNFNGLPCIMDNMTPCPPCADMPSSYESTCN